MNNEQALEFMKVLREVEMKLQEIEALNDKVPEFDRTFRKNLIAASYQAIKALNKVIELEG